MMTIRTEVLQVGKMFKNMKDMCKQLELEYKDSTNSRKAIIKEVEQYVELIKDGRKLIVAKVHEEKKEKIDERINNGHHENSRGHNIVYGDLLDKILIKHIQSSSKVSYLSVNTVALISGMINENYTLALKNRVLFSKYVKKKLRIENDTSIRNAFYHIRGIIKPTVDSCIKRLTNKNYIRSQYGYIVAINIEVLAKKLLKDYNIDINYIDKSQIEQTRLATEEEIKEIQKAEKIVLGSFGVDSITELNNEQLIKYFSNINVEIKKKYPEFEMVYKGYKIERLERVENCEKNCTTTEDMKLELMRIFLQRLRIRFNKDEQKIKNKINSFQERLDYFGTNRNYNYAKYELDIIDKTYVEDSMKICELLIKCSKEKLTVQQLVKFK